jgi:hypothetical protein
VDFFCQVMSPVAGSESIEGAGSVLAAQVKTVDNQEKPRLKLNRIDATDLLRQTHATCLFGLRLSDRKVHFQFLTKDFMDRLLDFLETDHQEFSIAYESMSDDMNLFQRLLRKYVSSFEQLQLRIHLIKRRVRKSIPGAHLSIESTNEDTVCQVYLPSAYSAFSIAPSAREEIRLKILRGGTIEPEKDPVELHPAILDALKETRSSRLELASASAEKSWVGIRWQGIYAKERFERHVYEDEVAYVHRAGFRLTHNTKPEATQDGYFHAMESEIFDSPSPLALRGRVLQFFRLFKEGALLSLKSDWSLPLSTFGRGLEHIGGAIDPIPNLCQSLGLPLSGVALSDIKDEEFRRTTWMLEALLLKGRSIGEFAESFVVGPAADLPLEQIPTKPISISVPLVLNWKGTGIVIWMECDGDGFLNEGLICGVRLKEQKSWKIEKKTRYQKSKYPELWISKDWPALAIGSKVSGPYSWIVDPAKFLPLEAVIKNPVFP